MTDLLSITCSRINVASLSRQPIVYVPFSKLIASFLAMLVKLGYIHTFKLVSNIRICVYLKYVDSKPAIRRLVRISTPGNRVFWRSDLKKSSFGNFQGFVIISSSRGLLSDQECLFYKLGGEPLVFVS